MVRVFIKHLHRTFYQNYINSALDFNDTTTETDELIDKTLDIAIITILLELEGGSTLRQPQMNRN